MIERSAIGHRPPDPPRSRSGGRGGEVRGGGVRAEEVRSEEVRSDGGRLGDVRAVDVRAVRGLTGSVIRSR